MPSPDTVTRSWIVDLEADRVRLRCRFRRKLQRIVRFTVQLEVMHSDHWHPVVRYDNAHGFCHRDTIHADGSQDKTPVFYGDANATFTDAVDDLQSNWRTHRDRYLSEIEND